MAQINIAGTLHNTEEIQGDSLNSHVVAHTDEILDATKEKKQSEVNADVDTALADRYTKEETYSKSQLDNLITTPDVQYVSVTATAQTTAVTDVLPATGAADTVYRVGSWDGSAFDAGKYSEYAWNGSAYQLLAVRSGSPYGVFDISANNLTEGQPTQYADLAAAFGSSGANVPENVRKGGMSVKFINSTSGKYEQWRLMAASWSTTVSDWQGVDSTPTAGSKNLVTSGGVAQKYEPYTDAIDSVFDDELIEKENGEDVGTINNDVINGLGGVLVNGFGKSISLLKFLTGNRDKDNPITKIYLALRKDDYQGEVLYSGYKDVAYTDQSPNRHEVEFDLSSNPISYDGLIYYQVWSDANIPIFGRCDADDYKFPMSDSNNPQLSYTTDNGVSWVLVGRTVDNLNIVYFKYIDGLESKVLGTGVIEEGNIKNEAVSEDKLATALKTKINGCVSDVSTLNTTVGNHTTAIGSLNSSVNEITNEVDSMLENYTEEYSWEENAENNTTYSSNALSGKGWTIAKNKTIYKVVINCGNRDYSYHPISQLKLVLRKDSREGDILASKIVNYPYSDNDNHDIEFDFSGSPISYSGEIYCTIQADSTYFKYSIISASDYDFDGAESYTTSTDLSTDIEFIQAGGSTRRYLWAKYVYKVEQKLVVGTNELEDECVTEGKLSDEVQEKLNKETGLNITVELPSDIVVTAGSNLQLFYRGIITAFNPYNYNVEVLVSNTDTGRSAGNAYPRYYQLQALDDYTIVKTTGLDAAPTGDNVTEISYAITNADGSYLLSQIVTSNSSETSRIQGILANLTANGAKSVMYIEDTGTYTKWDITRRTNIGTYDLTINLRDNEDKLISTASSVIRVIPNPSSPISQKNILVFGASIISKGYIADEMRRRLTDDSGTLNYPTNPLGLDLSNISFIGRKTGSDVQTIHQEATGGWSWESFASAGVPRYRFYVTDGSGNNIVVNDIFTISGLTFTVKEKNIDGNTGNGNFSCTYTGTLSGTVPTTGTINGTVNYSNCEAEVSGNPFWNPSKAGGAGIDFGFYSDTYCNGASIDILVSGFQAGNDFMNNDYNMETIFDAIEDILTAYHEYCTANNIDGVVIIPNMPVPDPTGGFGYNYFATRPDYYTLMTRYFEYSKALEELIEEKYSSYVVFAPVMQECDGEHMYPQYNMKVCNRVNIDEKVGANALHPTEIGQKIIADALYQSVCDVLS